MSDMLLKQLSARVRNLFTPAHFQKRYGDGKLQAKTLAGRAVEKKEAFPYGFCAKAKTGRVFVFCQGGNFDGFEILPLVADEGAALPELEENDAALYTENGGSIICREKGAVEINGKEKHFVTFEDLNKAVSAFMQGLNAHTHPASGSPPSAPMGFDISAAKTETVKTS